MATLDFLKSVLRQKATVAGSASASSLKQPLSDIQYSAGFDILVQESSYHDFIIPQLSQLLTPLFNSRIDVSVLEIGPGPKSVIGHLPLCLRRKVRRYTAFEPNGLFATRVEEWLCCTCETEPPLPCLESPPDIHRVPFVLKSNTGGGTFDLVLFCHSMYGMRPKDQFIKRALDMLVERPEGGMVVVFHRDGTLHLDGLVCSRMASHHTGVVRVANHDGVLDKFAPFVAGFIMQDMEANKALRDEWRKVCRTLGRYDHPNHLLFSAPNVMVAFTRHATTLPELTAQVPLVKDKMVKNREARLHRPAAIVRPTEVRQVQRCVQWAHKHGVGLAVMGGSHGGHCQWPNVVSVDMGAFDQVHVLLAGEDGKGSGSDFDSLVVAEAGCKTGDIIRKAMAAGVTVPLGSRPSVGAGLWLQGGIGHLARLYGLACDSIVGAVVVSVESSEVLCIGRVPSQNRPAGAVRPENETDLLWAMKGAGTNFGIVVSVTFKAYVAPGYSIRDWVFPLDNDREARIKLSDFDKFATQLPRNCSADAYLYWESGQLHLGVTMFESSTTKLITETSLPAPPPVCAVLGPEDSFKVADGVGLFEAEMYMSKMHGGHGGSRTSSFKRCVFLKNIRAIRIFYRLVTAVRTRPTPLCYLHLLQGGGAIADVAADTTAFGCRDWDFACVITGVWLRDQDGTEVAQAAKKWVYNVAGELLPFSGGAYGADLGPDPRDAALAAKAFGPNRPRLARLKQISDPRNVLAYACPLPKAPMEPKLIILITGESGVGKDFCADLWISMFYDSTQCDKNLTVCAVSISDATKKEYAADTSADLDRLLRDRAYKEQHRPALTTFFQDQVRRRPRLLQEHFLNVVYDAVDVDVLLITGMRDEAPVTALSHLVPDSRLLDVRVEASERTRWIRRGCRDDDDNNKDSRSNPTALDYRPSLILNNDATGEEAAKKLAEQYLLPFVHEDLQRLSNMVRAVPDFPRRGIEFRHVLDISQQPGGLALCTSLLQSHFTGDWAKVNAIACCEAGGFVYASALALQVGVRLALIREASKLPPPTISVLKSTSHISSSASTAAKEGIEIEIDGDLIPRGASASVVVVDDVLATGKTLCAVLQLLEKAGVSAEDISVMVVAEFPVHRGREFLRRRGFGRNHEIVDASGINHHVTFTYPLQMER